MKCAASILSMAIVAAVAGCEAPKQAAATAPANAPVNLAIPTPPAPSNPNQIVPFPLLSSPASPTVPSGAPGFSGLGLAPINSMDDIAGLQVQIVPEPMPADVAQPVPAGAQAADQPLPDTVQPATIPANQLSAADTLPASNPASQPVTAPDPTPVYAPVQYVYVPQYVVQPIYIQAEPEIVYQPAFYPYSFYSSFFFIDRQRQIDCSIVIHDRDRDHHSHPAVIISQGNRPPVLNSGGAGRGRDSSLTLPIKADPSFASAGGAALPPAKSFAARNDTALLLRSSSAPALGAGTPTRTVIATPAPLKLTPVIATGPIKTAAIPAPTPMAKAASTRVIKKFDPTPLPDAQPLVTLPVNNAAPQKPFETPRVTQRPDAAPPVRTPVVVRSADINLGVTPAPAKSALATKLETPKADPQPVVTVSRPESRPVVITPPVKTPDRIVVRDTTPAPQPVFRPTPIRSVPTPAPAPLPIRSPDPIVFRDTTPAPTIRPVVPVKTFDSSPSNPSFNNNGPANFPSRAPGGNRPGRTP